MAAGITLAATTEKLFEMNDHPINNPEQEARREAELAANKDPDGLYLGDSELQTGPEFQQDNELLVFSKK